MIFFVFFRRKFVLIIRYHNVFPRNRYAPNFHLQSFNSDVIKRDDFDISNFLGCNLFTRKLLELKWTHESLPTAWRLR